MASLEHTDHLTSEVIGVIKVIDAQAAKNGRLRASDCRSRLMEVFKKGFVEETSYSAATNHEWHIFGVGNTLVALFAGNHPVIYPTIEVGWVGCDEAGHGTVKRIISPARALSHWPGNIVAVAHPEGLFWCHPFHLKPFTRT